MSQMNKKIKKLGLVLGALNIVKSQSTAIAKTM